MSKIEPVAWVVSLDGNCRDNGFVDAMAWQEGEFNVPLYAAPPGLQEAAYLLRERGGDPWETCRLKVVADKRRAEGWQVERLYVLREPLP